jgi:hypothetical protein
VDKAANLALAASVTHALNINPLNYLSDCQQLVHFMNNRDSTNPPDWRIKLFTQVFTNTTRFQATRAFKISRSQSTTTNVLARQALSSQLTHLQSSCTSPVCALDCSILQALHLVGPLHVIVLTVACC